MQMSRRKINNKKVKERGEGGVTHISVFISHDFGGRKSIV